MRKEINALRQFLLGKGIDPDPPPVDLEARNAAIYNRLLDGLSYKEIGQEYKLTGERIKVICNRIERRKEREAEIRKREE